MDKQQLLKRFQTNYLSRQDVLFKLPLNISIDSFWPELLSWRKSRATMLPLHNANGQPLWYVTTDKMIKASERLCNEALDREETFDPYRIQMTQELSNALTQESYFTSFVEGADYTLENAIAFLRRGTEPENMMEQNVVNNFQALSYLLSALSVPIDERFVKDLAYILTDGQNDGTVEYRTEDTAPIPAMEGESYTVPPAFTLENHMAQFYAFLSDTRTHPLIKAAVGQAFILATRPFPEGNDRLARIISTAVLVRCGYDFFLDISISSYIAKENFRYFKAMKEIIRAENEGDMTYFVEYYLTMLVRALDSAKAERTEESREAEKQMAIQPLAASPPIGNLGADFGHSAPPYGAPWNVTPNFPATQATNPDMALPAIQIVAPDAVQVMEQEQPPQGGTFPQDRISPGVASPPTSEIAQLIANAVNITAFAEPQLDQPVASYRAAQSQAGSTQADQLVLEEAPLIEAERAEAYTSVLNDIAPLVPIENFTRKMSTILGMGIDKFDYLQWSDIHMIGNEDALIECDILYRAGIADRYLRAGRFVYLFRFDDQADLAEMVRTGQICRPQVASSPEGMLFWARLAIMEASLSDTLRRGAGFIRELIAGGVQEISKVEWMNRTGMTESEFTSCRDKVSDLGIAKNIAPVKKPTILRFAIADCEGVDRTHPIDKLTAEGISWNELRPTLSIPQMLDRLSYNEDSRRGQRIREFLLPRLNGNNDYFTSQDWETYHGISRTMADKDIRKAINLGLLERNEDCIPGDMHLHRLLKGPIPPIVMNGMADYKKLQLIDLYERFGSGPFTLDEMSDCLNLKPTSISYRLEEFLDRGYLASGRLGIRCWYRLAVNPKDNPEYFRVEEKEDEKMLMMTAAG